MSTATRTLVFNGINGATGDYLLPAMTPHDVARIAQGERLSDRHRFDLAGRQFRQSKEITKYGLIAGFDPKDLAQSGWGVIFARDADEDVREALAELLDHRRAAATAQAEGRYQEYRGERGYQPGESAYDFLARFGAGPGPANPDKVPYYLLIVGDPQTIPFHVQYEMDVERAVGRLDFDTLDEYARYARSVVTAETTPGRPRRAVLFGVQNADDAATELSATALVAPLAGFLAKDKPGWTVETAIGKGLATKARLQTLLGGADTPALLFTASHGMGFPAEDSRLLPQQGAILCQDWPGPRHHRGEIPQDFYVAADDITDDARPLGMIAFHFACYGAGTPRLDDFAHHAFEAVRPIAPHPFVAALPRALLGHPKGGALAAVGHIERAWGYSFDWPGAGPQREVFESTLKQLMEGIPLGAALEFFNGRYAELSTILTGQLNAIKQENRIPDDLKLAGLWIANNDARGYAIVGDPAVRLVVADDPAADAAREIVAVEPRVGRPRAEADASVDDGRTREEAPPSSVDGIVAADAAIARSGDAGPVAYWNPLGEGTALGEARDRLGEALTGLVANLGRALQSAVDDATSLRVVTYTSDDMEGATFDKQTGRFAGTARLRAVTRISFDGDTLVCVPEEDGVVDDRLWAIHADAVATARAHQAELLKAAVAAASGLLGVVR